MTELIPAYVWLALTVLTLGIAFYAGYEVGPLNGSRKAGARLILAAPVWPLALVLVVVKVLLYWVPRIWREAWS
jgi:hypothetical protein